MSDKPTELPEWGSDGGSVLVDPGGSKKATGFAFKERVGAQHLNWILEKAYRWLEWLDNGLLTRPSLTDNSPVMATTDRAGRVRSYLGPEGYTMGPVIQEAYRWSPAGSGVAVTSPMSIAASQANTYVDVLEPSSMPAGGKGTSGLRIVVQSAASTQRSTVHCPGDVIGQIDDTVIVMEWRARLNKVSGSSEVASYMGLHSAPENTILNYEATGYHVMFRHLAGSANWSFQYGASSDDTMVPVVVDTWYTFRIELHGVNSPVGVDAGHSVVRAFIDGAEVVESSSAQVPTGSAAYLNILLASGALSTPPSDVSLYVAPVKLAWNTVLDPDVPA